MEKLYFYQVCTKDNPIEQH